MFRFPFYSYPYNPYYKYYNNNHMNNNIKQTQPENEEEKNSITNSDKISNTINSRNKYNNDEQAIFEIFGIRLYLDDIIILGILFFLYKEDVKDEMLYIILFLLLFA